jgi:hypothetical protein
MGGAYTHQSRAVRVGLGPSHATASSAARPAVPARGLRRGRPGVEDPPRLRVRAAQARAGSSRPWGNPIRLAIVVSPLSATSLQSRRPPAERGVALRRYGPLGAARRVQFGVSSGNRRHVTAHEIGNWCAWICVIHAVASKPTMQRYQSHWLRKKVSPAGRAQEGLGITVPLAARDSHLHRFSER